MSKIFRKSSIKNYSDSEQLDRAVKVASPLSWLGIIGAAVLIAAVLLWSFFGSVPEVKSYKAVLSDKTNTFAVYSSVSGSIKSYEVSEGDEVRRGQVVAEVACSGESVRIKSPFNGIVGKLLFSKGEVIYAYDEILRLTPELNGGNVAVAYIPVAQSSSIKSGMEAKLFAGDESAYLDGEVIAVSDYAVSDKNMKYVIGRDNALKKSLTDEKAVVAVVCGIKNKQINGKYVLADNKTISVKKGSIIKAKIITGNRAPVSYLFGFLTSGEAKGE